MVKKVGHPLPGGRGVIDPNSGDVMFSFDEQHCLSGAINTLPMYSILHGALRTAWARDDQAGWPVVSDEVRGNGIRVTKARYDRVKAAKKLKVMENSIQPNGKEGSCQREGTTRM